MDWNALKIFLAIAETGSLSGAATKLSVNHSTIFRRLQAYEEDIGGRLFERINNRYELTLMGQDILAKAQGIEGAFADLERQIVGKDFQPKGVVKLTAPYNIAYYYLAPYITEFNKTYPEIDIELLVRNQEFNMNHRQADIAVRATSTAPEHLVGRKIGEIPWSVFGSQTYAKQYGLPKTIAELTQHRLIGATGNLRQLSAFAWLEKNYAQQIVIRCDELMVMSRLVEAGQGLALLPDDQKCSNIDHLFTLDMTKSGYLWLLTHPDLRNVERIRLVMRYLADAFAKETFYKSSG